jgi:chemotaxis protein methyltransferase CheR
VKDDVRRLARERYALRALEEDRAVDEALAAVGPDPDALAEALVNGETYFFRQPMQLALIVERLIPELLCLHRHLLLWSAGCATGEEAYSMAVLLDRAGLGDRVQIIASDISRRALEKAEAGRYRAHSFRDADPAIIDAYFLRSGSTMSPVPRIKERVRFFRHNLLEPRPLDAAAVQLILLRNVLIHLDASSHANIVRSMHEALTPGGYLITSATDPPLDAFAPFEVIETAAGLLWRRAAEVAPTTARPSAPKPAAPPRPEPILALADHGERREAWTACDRALADRPLDPLLHLTSAQIAIDLDRLEEAGEALRRAIYLAGRLPMAHFLLGVVRQRRGDRRGARSSFANARAILAQVDPQKPLDGAPDIEAGALLEQINRQLILLGSEP